MARLDNQVAIITGAGRGIGRAIALHYAREGAHVVVAEVEEESGKKVVEEASKLGSKATFIACDLNKLTDIQALMDSTRAHYGSIDILVNNAAVTRTLDFFDVSEADWDWIQNVNTKGLFFCMHHAAKVMKEQGGGKIVNISSGGGKGYPLTSNISYAGSKGAVIAMTRIAAHALGPSNINVNSICPGATQTELFHKVIAGKAEVLGKTREEILSLLESDIPIRRSNLPEDIADLAVFLASSASRNVTGQSWNVDGGLVFD